MAVEIQFEALTRGKNSEDTSVEKERMESKGTPRKVEMELKPREELGWRLA